MNVQESTSQHPTEPLSPAQMAALIRLKQAIGDDPSGTTRRMQPGLMITGATGAISRGGSFQQPYDPLQINAQPVQRDWTPLWVLMGLSGLLTLSITAMVAISNSPSSQVQRMADANAAIAMKAAEERTTIVCVFACPQDMAATPAQAAQPVAQPLSSLPVTTQPPQQPINPEEYQNALAFWRSQDLSAALNYYQNSGCSQQQNAYCVALKQVLQEAGAI